jgi:hypothetical protein
MSVETNISHAEILAYSPIILYLSFSLSSVLCDDVKKVISPELPKLSNEFEKVPPEAIKVQEEGIQAPPEVKDKTAKAER